MSEYKGSVKVTISVNIKFNNFIADDKLQAEYKARMMATMGVGMAVCPHCEDYTIENIESSITEIGKDE